MGISNLGLGAGDVLVDLVDDVVGAQGALPVLLQNGGAGIVAAGLDPGVDLDGEGDALSGQLLNGLVAVLQGQLLVEAAGCLAVGGVEALQLLNNGVGVVTAVGEVQQALHAEAQVLQVQGIDAVGPGPGGLQVDAVVQALAEVLVGNGGVPVGVGGTVGVAAVKVQLILIGVLLQTGLGQILVAGIAGIVHDDLAVGLAQLGVVDLLRLIEDVILVAVLDHGDGDGVEQAGVLVPVRLVLGQGLGVVHDVLGDGVGAGVPHGLVGHAQHVLNALLVDLSLGDRVEGGGGAQGVEIGAGLRAGIGQVGGVGALDAHLVELGVVLGGQSQSGGLVQALSVVIVVLGAHDHGAEHGSILGGVLVVVQDPLHSGDPVLGGAVGLVLALDVNPGHVVTEHEVPGDAAVRGIPLGGHGGVQLAVGVNLQQGGDGVAQDVQVLGLLGADHEEVLHLTVAGGLPGDQVLDGLAAVAGGGGLSGVAGGAVVAGAAVVAGGAVLLVVAAAAGRKDHHGDQQECQNTGSLSLHLGVTPHKIFQTAQCALPPPPPHRLYGRGNVSANGGNGNGSRAISGHGTYPLYLLLTNLSFLSQSVKSFSVRFWQKRTK